MSPKIAVYAGTFDPITNGHIDLAVRATRLFERVIVGVAGSPDKQPLFDLDERTALARAALADYPEIQVQGFSGLLIDFLQELGALTILRGLRAASDFEYEFQLASMNRRLDEQVETVFLTPPEQYIFVSASLVRELASYGGDVSPFVSAPVHEALKAKFAKG